MKNIKLLFSSLTVAFAILGLTRAVSYDVSMPIVFICMAISILITAKEYKDSGKKRDALWFLLLGIFLMIITVYNIASSILGI